MNAEVFALERALVAAATTGGGLPTHSQAAIGAVASRHLAVGTPRSFAIVGDGERAADSLAAHLTWFDPKDLRATDPAIAAAIGARVVSLDEALAADIVCIHPPRTRIAASQLRRGTHLNALGPLDIEDGLVARHVHPEELARIAAGFVDGRQLDEITIFNGGGPKGIL